MVYYGLTYNTTELVGNPYVNFALSALVELVAVAISHFTLEKFGRKVPYAINMVMSGVGLLLIQFVPPTASWMITVLALLAKFSISFTYNGIYIITAEIYPTVIRNSCVSTCQTFSRFGAVISPQIQLIVRGNNYFNDNCAVEIFRIPILCQLYSRIIIDAIYNCVCI
jgi:OCT family organic cation transporter-like MFS transporter 4/5